ncbi:MAG: PQQ-binding-like beta-propeller repeat protein [Deltaproteobacteria bacterium]|nr:PQQ-binding-like beta-propeller repeat protein [Deltaproteobacteria bacterium]
MPCPRSLATRALAFLVCTLAAAPTLHAADWTSWRGPRQIGVSDETGLVSSWSKDGDRHGLVWRDDFVGRSTPVVFDGRVCAFGRRGTADDRGERVACWSAADGKKRWEVPLVVHNTTIPFNRAGWSSPAGDTETGYLYAQGSDGHLSCFDRDGQIVWQRALHEEQGRFSGYGGRTANPLVFEDLVIANVISSSILGYEPPSHRYYAFDKRTGEIAWTSAPAKPALDLNIQANPVIALVDGRELMIGGAADGWIYALEPRTGRKVWEFQASKLALNTSVVVVGDTVYTSHTEENVSSGVMGAVMAIDATGRGDVSKTALRWTIPEIRAGYASPTMHDGVLYVVDDSAKLHGIDAATGREVWAPFKLGTVGKGSPVWADGRLYATEVNGRLWILEPSRDGVKVLDRDELAMPDGRYAEIYGSVAVSGGRVFFTTEEGIYCLGDRSKPFGGSTGLVAPLAPPRGSGAPATLALVPAEVLIAPGESVTFRTRAFDPQGRPLGAVTPASVTLEKLAGEVAPGGASAPSESRFTAGDVPFQAGFVTAKLGELTAKARVRVIAPPPWHEDFSTKPPGEPIPYWVFGSRFKVAQLDGAKVLNKFVAPTGLQRSRTYIGPAAWADYTIAASVLSRQKGSERADMGLVASGYTIELLGAQQTIQVSSWHSALRMARSVPFAWQPDVWYRVLLRVEPKGEKHALVRGKVWRRDQPEPAAWTIEVDDPFGVTHGAPGLYGYSPVDIYYDDVEVTPNVVTAAPPAPAAAVASPPPPVPVPAPPIATAPRAADASGAAASATAAPPRKRGPEDPATMLGGNVSRNMASPEKGLPDDWDVQTGKNVLWQAKLGSQSYGGPVVFGGKVFVGTNNGSPRDPKVTGDKGVVMAFDAKTGDFLWQLVHPKLPTGLVNDWPMQGVCSTPFVQRDRLYYVSNEGKVVCADTEGFHDGENDGPLDGEAGVGPTAGDVVWSYDLKDELGVFPHNMSASSPLAIHGILYAVTGNGVDEGHINVPAPAAPSFVALDQATGKLIWKSNLPGNEVLHGSWSSPSYGVAGGVPQVVFGGGNGWLYSFAPETGEMLWKFDANPKDAVWDIGGAGTRNNVIAMPVFHDGRVYVGVGEDPEHGEGIGHLWVIDATQRGDITRTGLVWTRGGEDFHRTISTVAIADGLLYAADLSGFLYCLDAATGRHHWTYDAFAAVWSSPLVADGKVYLADEDGDVAVLKHGRELKVLREINMASPIYTTPTAKDGVLYVSTRSRMFAISAR